MLRILVFECVQLAVSYFAIRRGGAPERIVGWMLLAAAVVSLGVGVPANEFKALDVVQLLIDLALLAGLVVIAARANRFWPQWLAALQLLAIGVHGVRAYDPFLVPVVYYRLSGRIAYPMCLALALGTYHYIRRWRIEGHAPAPWSPLRW